MKFLKIAVLGLLILLLGGYFVLAYAMGSIVKSGVNNFGPKLTQSPVVLNSASLSPLSGSGTLTGLTVGNPAGWSQGNAFALGQVRVDLEPFSVFGDTVVINEVTIDQPEFNYETRLVTSNIQDLLKNIEQFTGTGEATTSSGPPKKFIVKKLRLTNGKAVVQGAGRSLTVPLPEISLDNLGVAENGITAGQLATAVMRDVLSKVVTAAAGSISQLNLKDLSPDKLKDAAKDAGDALKKMLQKK